MPDYSKGIILVNSDVNNTPYTVQNSGWLSYRVRSSQNNESHVFIDGIEVVENYTPSGDERSGTLQIRGMIPVEKGSVITYTKTKPTLIFYSCKS